jgi:hypothetical protein
MNSTVVIDRASWVEAAKAITSRNLIDVENADVGLKRILFYEMKDKGLLIDYP